MRLKTNGYILFMLLCALCPLFFSQILLGQDAEPKSPPATSIHYPDKEWKLASVDSVGLPVDFFAKVQIALNDQKFGELHSFLVVKNGQLVFEHYQKPIDKNTVFPIYSVTKSITCLLVLMAIEQGKIDKDLKVYDLFARYRPKKLDPRKAQMTLTHLLEMTSGFNLKEWETKEKQKDNFKMQKRDDWVQYVLEKRMASEPGKKYCYSTCVSLLLSAILDQKVKGQTAGYAAKQLWEPLGIKSAKWILKDRFGRVHGGSGLSMTARDMARIGLLLLRNGRWKDKQIFQKASLDQATKIRHKSVIPKRYKNYHYGQQFWIYETFVNGKEIPVYGLMGRGGQVILICPTHDLAIISTASNVGSHHQAAAYDILKSKILPKLVQLEEDSKNK